MNELKDFLYSFINFFLNCIVGHLPCWPLRRLCYQAAGVKIGKGSRILMGTKFQGWSHISIGSHSYINSYCHLDGRGGLSIGDNVNISNYSRIISAGHDMKSGSFSYRTGAVVIENYCWLGTGATVLDRSHLLPETVIGAGSVFKGESVKGGVYIGVPAIFVKNRNLSGHYDVEWRPFFS